MLKNNILEAISFFERIGNHFSNDEIHEIKESIKKKIKKVFSNIPLIDLDKIPLDKLKRQYIDYSIALSAPSIDSRIPKLSPKSLKEDREIKKTLPIKIVKDEMVNRFHLEDWQFIIALAHNGVDVALVIPNIESNRNIIVNAMYDFGYYESKEHEIVKDGMIWIQIQFEPYNLPDVNEELLADGYLYHITPTYNIEKIKESGLIPMNCNTFFNYPPRIYFLRGYVTFNGQVQLAKALSKQSPVNCHDYSIIAIDVSKIPNNVKFMNDSNQPNGIFTYDAIPSNAIANINNITV